MWIGTGISAALQKACMIIRINGVQNAPVPVWRALAGNIPMIGMLAHLERPRALVPGSVMPGYAFLSQSRLRN